jgi:hypothetical protein
MDNESTNAKRWAAVITYIDKSNDECEFEEFLDFADTMAHGPDWNLIDKIEIRLNHRHPIGAKPAF